MIRSRRLVPAAVGGAVVLSCALPAAPARAAPRADGPAGTVRLATERRVTVDYPWAGASGFRTYGELSIVPIGIPTAPAVQTEARIPSPSVIGEAPPPGHRRGSSASPSPGPCPSPTPPAKSSAR
ncbi:hypothetical protein ACWD0Z_03375 [Streptomyces sp. NPDC003007]